MAVKTLTYVLLGKDALSPVAERAGANVEHSFGRAESVLGKLGKTAALASGAMVAGFGLVAGESVKMATDFQGTMERIHTQAGASQQSVESLSKSVLALGGKVQQSPEQLAESLYHLKSVGMDDADAMLALKQASGLAAAGGADLEATTNALAGAWRSGIKGAHTFGQSAATVNAIIGAGNMKMEDFVTALGTGILPAAKTFGVSMSSVGAALALMTDEGVPAVDASTRLRMSLSLLGAPSNHAIEVLSNINLKGRSLAQAMRGPQGIIGAVELLHKHLQMYGGDATNQAMLVSRAFGGGRSSSAIMTLLNNLDVLKKKQDQINHSMGKYGQAVIDQRKTAQAQFAMLRSAADTLMVHLGLALLPPLTSFVHFLDNSVMPAVGKFAGFVSSAFHGGFGSGFVDSIKNVGSEIGNTFGPQILADLKNFGTFVGQVFVSIRNLAVALAPVAGIILATFGGAALVALRALGTILSTVLGPALQSITGFIERNKTLFGALAIIVATVTTAMLAQKVVTLALGAGMKILQGAVMLAWRAQALLDAAMDANIFGVIAVAVIALAAAFVYAWKHSATFRNIIKDIGSAMLEFGILVVKADKIIVDSFLSMVGTLLHGAVDAFGWVPGLGGALKSASRGFDSFKAHVDNSINGAIGTMERWRSELNGADNAVQKLTKTMVGDFDRQRDAAQKADYDLSKYTQSIRNNGANSEAAKAARNHLYSDLVKSGVGSGTARKDLDAYTNAIRKNGANSDAARAARSRLNSDISRTFENSERGKRDMDALSTAIRKHGQTSDAAKSARSRLILDLINAGVDANSSRKMVDNLSTAIRNMKGKVVTVGADATAHGSITITGTGWASGQGGIRLHAARGAYVDKGTGPRSDDVLAAVSRGELIVPAHMVKAGFVDHLRGLVPGFRRYATGGLVGSINGIVPTVASNVGRDSEKAIAAGVKEALKAAKKMLEGSGPAIARYARSFAGKIPYVWGGTSLTSGADCSGFVTAIYRRFGIFPPRTSEAQGAWVKRTGPVPGGLAFYNSPAGGPPPGHVAIVQDSNTVISQGGGMGPQIIPLHALPLMFTGVPPGGFPGGGGFGGNGPINGVARGSLRQMALSLLRQHGWLGQWPAFNSLENSEAGWNMHARNASGAYGLAQFIGGPAEYYQYGGNPNTGLGQLTGMMNYIGQRYGNPNNAWAFHLGHGYYDNGGPLYPGWTLAYNGTGRTEWVHPPGRSGGDTHVHVHIHGHAMASKQEIGRHVSDSLREFERKGGNVPYVSK